MKIAIIIFSTGILISCNLQSQTYKISVSRSYDYPIPKGVIIPAIQTVPAHLITAPDSLSIWRDYSYVNYYSDYLLPTEPYLNPFYVKWGNLKPHPLLFKRLGKDKIAFILDADGDADFLEEKVDTISINQQSLVMRQFMLSEGGEPCPLLIPLNIEATYEGEDFQLMRIQSLLKYELRYPVGNDTLSVDIRVHHYNIWCYLNSRTVEDSILKFRLNEPFTFKGNYYKLSELDLCGNTIQLETLSGNKVMGYREGQNLDMTMLQQLTNKHLMPGSKAIEWKSKPYLLLHFWGEWCEPCKAELYPPESGLRKTL